MAKSKAACCCGNCHIRQTNCNACKKCIPKYLCVEVVVTPGPYTDLSPCCETFGFRMPYNCGTRTYTGGETCQDGVALDIVVTLEDTQYGCTTTVSSSLLDDDLVYEGTLPAISFSVVDGDGDQLDVTIGAANVVENPLTRYCDSECICASCLPGALCIVGSLAFPLGDPMDIEARRFAVSAGFDCDALAWIFDGTTVFSEADQLLGYSVAMTIELQPPSAGHGCAIRIRGSASTPDGSGEFDDYILLDAGLPAGQTGGSHCESFITDDEQFPFTLGQPTEAGDEFIERYMSRLCDQAFIFDNTDPYPLVVVGSVNICEQSCGQCVVCDSPSLQPCCCGAPVSVTVTCGAGSCTLTRTVGTPDDPPYVWSDGGVCVCQGTLGGVPVSLSLSCACTLDEFGVPTNVWELGPFEGSNITLTEESCSPLLLSGGGYTITE